MGGFLVRQRTTVERDEWEGAEGTLSREKGKRRARQATEGLAVLRNNRKRLVALVSAIP